MRYDFDAAKKNAENSFTLTSMTNIQLADQAIRLTLIKKDFDTAVALANQHISKFNTVKNDTFVSTFAIFTLLLDKIKQNNPKQALEIFEKYKNNFSKPMRALIGGTIYRANNNFKKAELIEADLNGFALFDMMRTYHAANSEYLAKNIDKALILYKKAGSYFDPLSVRSTLSAVQIYLSKGEKNKALELLQKSKSNQPDGLLWAATQNLEQNKEFNFKLPETYLEVLGEDLYNIAVLYARQHDYETSIAFLKTAEISNISHVYLLSAMAEIYALIKNYNKSAKIYLSIAKNDQFLIGRESIVSAAFTLNEANKFNESEKILKKAMKNDPTHYQYPYFLADIYRGENNFKEAIVYFNKTLDLIGEKEQKIKWKILYGRGICYEQTNQWEKAERDFLAALELAPHNPDLINYLAYSWVDRNVHLEKALIMLKSAVRNRPDNGYIADSLGWAYYRIKDYNNALPILELAISLLPYDSTINDHLGDLYWQLGRKNEAEFQWKHALDFNPTKEKRQYIEAKIAVGYEQADTFFEKMMSEKNNKKHHVSQIPEKSFFTRIISFINTISNKNERQ
jgi:tetratricopeptide (TPR) repeat protein